MLPLCAPVHFLSCSDLFTPLKCGRFQTACFDSLLLQDVEQGGLAQPGRTFMNHRHNRVNVDPSPYLTTTDEGYRLKGKAMHISSSTNLQCNRLRAMKSTHAARALHQVRAVGQKPRGFSSPIKRLHHGIWLAEESSKTNHSTTWITLMMSLLPSIGVGMVGSALTGVPTAPSSE